MSEEKKRGWFVAIPLTPNTQCPYRDEDGNPPLCFYRNCRKPCTLENCQLRRTRGAVIKEKRVEAA